MKAIKDTWNGYLARRRLDQLWQDLQTQETEQQQLNQFLTCFLTLVQNQPCIEQVFGHRGALLTILLKVLKEPELSDTNLKNVLQALLHITKDLITLQNGHEYFDHFLNIGTHLALRANRKQSPKMLKQSLRFIQFLFSKVENLKFTMAKQNFFLHLLNSIDQQDELCQNHILTFFKKELAANTEKKESGERLSLLSDSSNNNQKNTIGNLISQVKSKVNEISNEYRQELQAERFSDLELTQISQQIAEGQSPFEIACPFSIAEDADFQNPLTQEQIESLLNKKDSVVRGSSSSQLFDEESPNTQVLSFLQGEFMTSLISKIKECGLKNLLTFVNVAEIVGCFQSANWTESQRLLLPNLKQRFQTFQNNDQSHLLPVFQFLMGQVTDDESRVRDLNMLGVVLKIVKLANQTPNEFEQLLTVELKGLMMKQQANPVIFLKIQGFQWLQSLHFTESLFQLATYLLHILCDAESQCLNFIIAVLQSLVSDTTKEDSQLKIQLVQSFFQDLMHRRSFKVDTQLMKIVQICFEIYEKESSPERLLLVAICLEFQLKMDRSQTSILPQSVFKTDFIEGLCRSQDLQKVYVAAQILKCAIHSGTEFHLSFLQKPPRPTFILKLLFGGSQNIYADEMKQKIPRSFIMFEYSALKEAILLSETEKIVQLFVELAIIVSDSPHLKSMLDELFSADKTELVENLCLSNFSLSQQKILINCLLEHFTEKGFLSNDNIFEQLKPAPDSEYLSFIQSSKIAQPLYKICQQLPQENTSVLQLDTRQQLVRRIDLNLLMLVVLQASPETVIYFFQSLLPLLETAQNRLTLILQGFQKLLLQIIELSASLPRQQYLYLRQQAFNLYEILLQQNVIILEENHDELADLLLQPMLFSITSRVICQRPSPKIYRSLDLVDFDESCGFLLKTDIAFEKDKLLFSTAGGQQISLVKISDLDPTFKTLDYQYSITTGEINTFDLQGYIKLGLFEPIGWNTFTVVNGILHVNKAPTSLKIESPIVSFGESVLIGSQKQVKSEQKVVHHLSLVESQNKSQIQVFGCYQTYEINEITIETLDEGWFGSTKNILSLKELFLEEKQLRKVMSIFQQSRSEENILATFRLLAALTSPDLDLSTEIEVALKSKLLEMHPEGIRKLMGYMLDFSLDRIDAHCSVNPNEDRQVLPELKSPQLLELPFSMLNFIPGDQGAYFLEMLQLVLKDQTNLILFFRNFGFKPISALLTMIKDSPRKAALYEITISLTELMINGVRQKILDTDLLSKLVQYLLVIAHEDQKQIITRIVIDCFSVLMIHLVVDESNTLLDQILDLAPAQIFYCLLQSKVVEIREYAFKIITLLLSKAQIGLDYELVSDLLRLQEQSMNLCMIVVDAACQKFENVNDVAPTDDALVIQMMNRSQQASKIVSQINDSLIQKKRGTRIVHFEFLQCFFAAISKVKNDIYRHLCIKQLTSVIQQSQENFDIIFSLPLGLQKLLEDCFNFQIAVTTSDDLSYTAKQFYSNHLFERFVNSQAVGQQTGYSTTEDDPMHTSGNKSDTARTNSDFLPPTRSLDAVLELITQLCVRDLSRKHGESQVFNILLMHPSLEDQFQIQIISRVLKHFHKQPKVTERDTLLNLHKIFSGIQKLMSSNEAIDFRIINLINEIAFKSTMEIRRLMKDFKLLELRDNMMVAQILRTYKLRTESLVKQLSQFSFETLASKPLFSSRRCPEFLLLLVTDRPAQTEESHFTTLHHKLITEVIQFEHNKCLPNIEQVLKQGQLSKEDRSFLIQLVQEQLNEEKEITQSYAQERTGRRRIFCDEDEQKRLQRNRNLQSLINLTSARLRQKA